MRYTKQQHRKADACATGMARLPIKKLLLNAANTFLSDTKAKCTISKARQKVPTISAIDVATWTVFFTVLFSNADGPATQRFARH